MDARIVNAFLSGGAVEAEKAALEIFPDMYTGGACQLEIEWIPIGTAFEITEYDGYESINIIADKEYLVT